MTQDFRALRAIAFAVLTAFCAVAGSAQTTLSPAYVVNEKAITPYEIDQRAQLLRAFGAGGDLRALSLEQLIGERLQIQMAEDMGIELTEEQRQAVLQQFASSRNLTPEQVPLALRGRGIAFETLQAFLDAGAMWREVVQARFRARATPSEADLDAALGLTGRRIQESVLLQEIAMPTAERGEEETLRLAKELSRSLNRGGNFGAAVARYSRAPTAGRGGRLNWIPAANLPPAVAGQILALMPGEVTAPVTVPQGVLIFKLLDRREDAAAQQAAAAQDTVVYAELIVALGNAAPAEAVAQAEQQLQQIADEARLCSDLEARAGEFALGSGRSEPTPAAGVPINIARTIAGLEVGEKTVQRDGRGVVLVMLCSRGADISGEEREALRARLFNQRMNALAQGLLQELRADAVIEER